MLSLGGEQPAVPRERERQREPEASLGTLESIREATRTV